MSLGISSKRRLLETLRRQSRKREVVTNGIQKKRKVNRTEKDKFREAREAAKEGRARFL
jgi:hypothetical protein